MSCYYDVCIYSPVDGDETIAQFDHPSLVTQYLIENYHPSINVYACLLTTADGKSVVVCDDWWGCDEWLEIHAGA